MFKKPVSRKRRFLLLAPLFLLAFFACGCEAASLLLPEVFSTPAASSLPHETPALSPTLSSMPSNPPALNAPELLGAYAAEHFEQAYAGLTYADLTHDGQDELLVVQLFDKISLAPLRLAQTAYAGYEFSSMRLTVYAAESGEVRELYSRELLPGEQGRYFALTVQNGMAYLFEYAVVIENSSGSLTYAAFSLTAAGEPEKAFGDSLSFYYVDYENRAYVLDRERQDIMDEFVQFDSAAQTYIDEGALLLGLCDNPLFGQYLRYLGSPGFSADALLKPEADYDGDGLPDGVELACGDEKAQLTVTLSSGAVLTKEFEGGWGDARAFTAGDVDGDGDDELAVSLSNMLLGGHYASLHVLDVKNGALAEFPQELFENTALHISQPISFGDKNPMVVGGGIVRKEEGAVLRIKFYDAEASQTVRYVDARLVNGAWQIAATGFTDAGLGVFSEAEVPLCVPGEVVSAAKHREGYVSPKVSFSAYQPQGEFDPYVRTYDAETGALRLSCAELADIALRQLYDLTGYLPETIHTTVYGYPQFCIMPFSLREGGARFYSYSFGRLYGFSDIGSISLSYKETWSASLIEAASPAFLKPEDFDAMTREEIAEWYYTHLSFGDGRQVMKAVPSYENCIRLVFADGDFVEVDFADDLPFPYSIYGPYAEGAQH